MGTWNVYNGAGQRAGTNTVRKILGECVISENWEGSLGTSGKSYSSYDPAIEKWQQTWVSNKGGVTLFSGELIDGAMVFQQVVRGDDDDGTLKRMVLDPQEDGTITQRGEQSFDDGDTWKTNWQLTYVREEEDSGSADAETSN